MNKAETIEIQRLQCPACGAHIIIDEDGTVTAHAEEPAPVETEDDSLVKTKDDSQKEPETDQPVRTEDNPSENPKKRSSRWRSKKKN